MYGLINMAIKQLVIDKMGEAAWESILEKSQVKQSHFELLSVYEDDITFKLVEGVCSFSGKTQAEILNLFGTYWVSYATSAGFGPLLKLFGPTFKECLYNLNKMHDHIGALMPGLIPPSFEIEKENSSRDVILLYKSTRSGLSPMVSGLLSTLGARYEIVNLQIEHLGKSNDGLSERFSIKWD